MEMVRKEGGQFVLLSYFNLRKQPSERWLNQLSGLHCLVDSGAYSFFKQKLKSKKHEQLTMFDESKQVLESYAAFINEHKHRTEIVGFINLDVVGDPQKTKENYRYLLEHTQANIIPVWQVSDTYDELENLVNRDPNLLCIGGLVPLLQSNQKSVVQEILQKVFSICKNTPVHGLGIANELITKFPFHSVDSIAWLSARKDGSRKVYAESAKRENAPSDWSTTDILQDNIRYLSTLEYSYV